MNDSQVAILGCGPAGLLAAHAVALAGKEPLIYSKPVKSKIGGAQYLHSAIPGIADHTNADKCLFVKEGQRRVYAMKVYGNPLRETSWDDFPAGEHEIWNMRQAYDELWSLYAPYIQSRDVTPDWVAGWLGVEKGRHLISTIPAKAICPNPHKWIWEAQDVWIYYGQDAEVSCGPMEIRYSGRKDEPFYRESDLFGWKGREYSTEMLDAVHILKPLRTDWPGIHRVHQFGRYGRWAKKTLIHDAFFGTKELLDAGIV